MTSSTWIPTARWRPSSTPPCRPWPMAPAVHHLHRHAGAGRQPPGDLLRALRRHGAEGGLRARDGAAPRVARLRQRRGALRPPAAAPAERLHRLLRAPLRAHLRLPGASQAPGLADLHGGISAGPATWRLMTLVTYNSSIHIQY